MKSGRSREVHCGVAVEVRVGVEVAVGVDVRGGPGWGRCQGSTGSWR
jgi:hypothetical protein